MLYFKNWSNTRNSWQVGSTCQIIRNASSTHIIVFYPPFDLHKKLSFEEKKAHIVWHMIVYNNNTVTINGILLTADTPILHYTLPTINDKHVARISVYLEHSQYRLVYHNYSVAYAVLENFVMYIKDFVCYKVEELDPYYYLAISINDNESITLQYVKENYEVTITYNVQYIKGVIYNSTNHNYRNFELQYENNTMYLCPGDKKYALATYKWDIYTIVDNLALMMQKLTQ